jgi:surface antigen
VSLLPVVVSKKIAQIVVIGLFSFLVTGCLSQNLAVAPAEPTPFWAMEYTVRAGRSDHMALTYGWRFTTTLKERADTNLSDDDRERAHLVLQSVLEHNPTGVASIWNNPMTGYSGTVIPTRTVTPKDRPPCRDFVIVVNIGGNEAHGYGRYFKETSTACREDAGNWEILKG